MRLFKIIILFFFTVISLASYGYQVYVGSDGNTQTSNSATQQQMPSFLSPQTSDAQNTLSANNIIDNDNSQDPQARALNAAISESESQPDVIPPKPDSALENKSTSSADSSSYTDEAKGIWLTRCLTAISGTRVKAYAQEYCDCGWQHISSGELPPDLLSSLKAEDARKRNAIMVSITQMCMVQIIQKHNL